MLENEDIDLLVDLFDHQLINELEDEKIAKLSKKLHLIQMQIEVQTDAQKQIQKIHEEMKNL